MTEVRDLLRRCDEGSHTCLAECDDNHMIAGLLLEVLREMPTSLFDFEDFLALQRAYLLTKPTRGPACAAHTSTMELTVVVVSPQSLAILQTSASLCAPTLRSAGRWCVRWSTCCVLCTSTRPPTR